MGVRFRESAPQPGDLDCRTKPRPSLIVLHARQAALSALPPVEVGEINVRCS
jgi:hypothetical protein